MRMYCDGTERILDVKSESNGPEKPLALSGFYYYELPWQFS